MKIPFETASGSRFLQWGNNTTDDYDKQPFNR